jgi:hypothetical protein
MAVAAAPALAMQAAAAMVEARPPPQDQQQSSKPALPLALDQAAAALGLGLGLDLGLGLGLGLVLSRGSHAPFAGKLFSQAGRTAAPADTRQACKVSETGVSHMQNGAGTCSAQVARWLPTSFAWLGVSRIPTPAATP